ncbi:uncharacterized protein BDV14DRAFT_129243 [Aspergillus stella-maris]|uniref:uncharacterized protein n=1 Tax=Aspergillus stella-maris TaxID=1810926 RepID=UPI003CCDEFEB
MFYAATATHPISGSLEMPYRQVQLNHRHKLPEKHVTQQALDAFFQCAATLIYVTTEEKASQLLDNVYDSDSASMQDICELCALAAIGSHYKVDVIPDEARGNYFFIASTGLHDAIEAEGIQGMRTFICLCMSMVMEKSSIARLLIVSALNLARGKMVANLQAQRTASAGSQDDEHRRTLQTLQLSRPMKSPVRVRKTGIAWSQTPRIGGRVPKYQHLSANALPLQYVRVQPDRIIFTPTVLWHS